MKPSLWHATEVNRIAGLVAADEKVHQMAKGKGITFGPRDRQAYQARVSERHRLQCFHEGLACEAEALEEKAVLLEHLRENGLWITNDGCSIGFRLQAQDEESFYANLRAAMVVVPEESER